MSVCKCGYAPDMCKEVSCPAKTVVRKDELTRLRAERDALRADAERYRWLASRAHKETAYDRYGNGALWRIGFAADDSRHALDAVIDAALKEAK